MKLIAPEIAALLRTNLQVAIGRHLYCVLGSYAQLAGFERDILSELKLPNGQPIRPAVNLNLALLNRIGDDDLRDLVRSEGKRPQAIQRRLNLEFDALLANLLETDHFLVIKQIELLFAYHLDLQAIRARATNQNHILLLLPGELRGDHVALFTEAETRFQRELPAQLIADNHLWELADGKHA